MSPAQVEHGAHTLCAQTNRQASRSRALTAGRRWHCATERRPGGLDAKPGGGSFLGARAIQRGALALARQRPRNAAPPDKGPLSGLLRTSIADRQDPPATLMTRSGHSKDNSATIRPRSCAREPAAVAWRKGGLRASAYSFLGVPLPPG